MAGSRAERQYVIAQFSDVHCGDPRFDEQLMLNVVRGVNEAKPDLVVVPGDLTAFGYAEQYEEFAGYLALIECENRIVIAGNHDCRNVGYEFFERVIGPRNISLECDFPGGRMSIVAIDSNIPDLNDGEVGRDKIARFAKTFAREDFAFRMLVLHHHLVSIPATGRERNVVWDAGDVLHAARQARVDLVLAGHKHVPYAWPIADTLIVTSGTGASRRTRGDASPSYNLIRIGPKRIEVDVVASADGQRVSESFPRREDWHSARAR